MLTLLFSAALAATAPPEAVTFTGASDPDVITLADGRSLRIGYGRLLPAHVEGFGENHALELGYWDDHRGTYLRDPVLDEWAEVFVVNGGKHPIDVIADACLETAMSTADMHGCLITQRTHWAAEVDRMWQAVEAVRTQPEQTKAIRAARAQWEAHRAAQVEIIQMIYGQRDGTMWGLAAGISRVDLLRDQAVQLAELVVDAS